MKIDKADTAFSRYIRQKARWICQRCGIRHEEGGLQASHFIGRANESVRFDEENVTPICGGCHMYLTANPLVHVEWMKHRLGPEKFQALRMRANEPSKLKRKQNREFQYHKYKLLLAELSTGH